LLCGPVELRVRRVSALLCIARIHTLSTTQHRTPDSAPGTSRGAEGKKKRAKVAHLVSRHADGPLGAGDAG